MVKSMLLQLPSTSESCYNTCKTTKQQCDQAIMLPDERLSYKPLLMKRVQKKLLKPQT